jgi:hypothetical protein
VQALSKIAGNILGLLTLAGFAAVVVGTIQGFSSGFEPLAFVGPGLIILAGIPWTHTPGKKWLKAAFLALVGFIVGGTAGGFVAYKLSPHEPDIGAPIVYLFGGFVVGGLLLTFLGILWTIRFHCRYAA